MISIIIPVYNTGPKLVRCIESILKQTYQDFELIIINDGSTCNKTNKICQDYFDMYDNISLVITENSGAGAARNKGIDLATKEFVVFVDSDDYIEPEMLEKLVNHALCFDSELVLCDHVIDGNYSSGRYPIKTPKSQVLMFEEVLKLFLVGHWHSSCTKLYRRSLIGDIRFQIGKMNEDYLFNYMLLKRTGTFYYLKENLYHYCKNDDSRTSQASFQRLFDWIENVDFVSNEIAEHFDKNKFNKHLIYQKIFCRVVTLNRLVFTKNLKLTVIDRKLIKQIRRTLFCNLSELIKNDLLSTKYKIMALLIIISPLLYIRLMKICLGALSSN